MDNKECLKFYLKVVKDWEDLGFKLNPCDGCAANKVVKNKTQEVT